MFTYSHARQFCLVTVFLVLCCLAAAAQEKDWRPVSPQDLAAKAPAVESDADAEALFWEVRIDDSSSDDLALAHYVRVKIFTEKGRERYSKFDIPFTKRMKIKDLQARVIKADGSIVELAKTDIFEREIVRAGGKKVKAKSFAVPNIEPGVIVEYKYRETIDNAGAVGMKLEMQRDIPIQSLSYYYRPYDSKPPKFQYYNIKDVGFAKDKNGYFLASRSNVPAFKEESRMPPDDMVRPWLLLTGSRVAVTNASAFGFSYVVKDSSNTEKYWGAVSSERVGLAKFMTKTGGDVKKAALEVTAGATTNDEKLQKLYAFVQGQIRNTTFDNTLTDDQRAKLPEIRSIGEVLKNKSASSQYIDLLFGAMASSLGMDARIALAGDRSEMFFTPEMTNDSFIHPAAIAVKVGEQWKFFNPGVPMLPYGMLVWYEEDAWAMLVGTQDYLWVKTPMTDHTASVAKRKGKFRLLEDGTLTGTVEIQYFGQQGLVRKMDAADDSPNKREEDLKTALKARMSSAEISGVAIENISDPAKPLIHRYTVNVPNYAQRTGKRLFVQPGFFEYGVAPPFSAAARKYDVYFNHPWSEEDEITITYPKDFDLDNADAPPSFADAQKISSLAITIGADRAGGLLEYKRKFHFGGGGNILFASTSYPAVKSLFDVFHKADNHILTLKQK